MKAKKKVRTKQRRPTSRRKIQRKKVRRRKTSTKRRLKHFSAYLQRAFPTLRKIARDPQMDSRRRRLLKACKRKDVCYGLKELALNQIKGNLGVDKNNFQGNNELIRLIATAKDRRNLENLTTQSGGILPFLIPAAAATLEGLLKNVLF